MQSSGRLIRIGKQAQDMRIIRLDQTGDIRHRIILRHHFQHKNTSGRIGIAKLGQDIDQFIARNDPAIFSLRTYDRKEAQLIASDQCQRLIDMGIFLNTR